MIHVTLNTGHVCEQPLDAVGREAVDVLVPLVRTGGGQLPAPFAGFRVEILRQQGGAVFTVWRAREPVATAAVAWDAGAEAEMWSAVEGLYLLVSDRFTAPSMSAEARKPDRLPWLAVVLLPGLASQSREDVGWLGDFERCLAVALMSTK